MDAQCAGSASNQTRSCHKFEDRQVRSALSYPRLLLDLRDEVIK
jgi:hypothetical protein